MELTVGISPCPNDTFIFFALLHGHVDTGGIRFRRVHLEDVETLNEWAMEGRLDVTKVSYHAYGHIRDEYALLSAGSALGRGCGPLLVCRRDDELDLAQARIAIPGRYTTAAMLLRLFAPECTNTVAIPFDQIISHVSDSRVDGGVIIHESRFTYDRRGLRVVRDLGEWWESRTGLPIPLGGICARRSFGKELLLRLEEGIKESVLWAFKHPEECGAFVRAHAQEMENEVIDRHIGLYVNSFSVDLGDEGKEAVLDFLRRGVKIGLFPRGTTKNEKQLFIS